MGYAPMGYAPEWYGEQPMGQEQEQQSPADNSSGVLYLLLGLGLGYLIGGKK